MPFSNLFHHKQKPVPKFEPPAGPPPSTSYAPPAGPPPQTAFAPPPGPPPHSSYISYPEPLDAAGLPPQYSEAVGKAHIHGLMSDAPEAEAEAGESYCNEPEVQRQQDLCVRPPAYIVDHIRQEGCKAWTLEPPAPPRWHGRINTNVLNPLGGPAVVKVITEPNCQNSCLFSNLPIMVGEHLLPPLQRIGGCYYEVRVLKMGSAIAIGTICKPYPNWRFPGWNRRSFGLHLDDYCFFKEDPDGGIDYDPLINVNPLQRGDTFGCGLDLQSQAVFFTRNGKRLEAHREEIVGRYAFEVEDHTRRNHTRKHLTIEDFTVFAAIGVEGESEFEVNFGGEGFAWEDANNPQWRVENLVGRSSLARDELPSYGEEPQ